MHRFAQCFRAIFIDAKFN